MISTNEFKTGQTIQVDGNIFVILEFLHVKPGKGGAFVRTKLRNLRTNATIDYTFNAGVKVPKAQINKVSMQYLYASGDTHVFMNSETFDQIELSKKQIENELNYIYEGLEVEVMFFDHSEVLGVIVPEKITLEVIDTVPGVKGDTKTNAMKDATLQTGFQIKVPMFIESGEKVIVNTTTGQYVSRA